MSVSVFVYSIALCMLSRVAAQCPLWAAACSDEAAKGCSRPTVKLPAGVLDDEGEPTNVFDSVENKAMYKQTTCLRSRWKDKRQEACTVL